MADDDLTKIIMQLRDRLDRWPTEDEVMQFIFGTEDERREVWNAT